MRTNELVEYDPIDDKFISGKQRFQFIGPFYTGFIIDTIDLVAKGYQSQQLKIKEYIVSKQNELSNGWSIEGYKEENSESLDLWNLDDLSGTSIVPNSFLRKLINLSNEPSEINEQSYTYKDSMLIFHDYGTGVFTINVEVDLNKKMSYKEYLDFVKAVSDSFSELLNPIISKTVEFLDTCLKEQEIHMIYIKDSIHKKYADLMKNNSPFKQVLWKHIVIYLESKDEIPKMHTPEYEEFLQQYNTFIWSSQEEISNKSIDPQVFAYPGMLFSFVLYAPGGDSLKYTRAVELAEYVYGSMSLLNNIEFIRLTDFVSVKEENLSIREVEKSIDELKEINDRLDYFFIVLDNITVQFSPQTTKIYENFKNEWYLNRLIDDLKKKEKDLEEELESYLDYLTEKRQATLNRFVKIFTVFAVVGPAFEIYTVFYSRGIDLLHLDLIYYLFGAIIGIILLIGGIVGYIFYRKF